MKAAELPGLNLLRLLASLYMVMYHLSPWLGFDVLPAALTRGSSGTSLFFLLSGFLLAHLYAGKKMGDQQQRQFVWRRIARILPTNLIGIAFLLWCRNLQGQLNFEWNKLVECGLLLQSWVVGDSHIMNAPAWSMSCLLFFYLIFPVVLPILSKTSSSLLVLLLAIFWLFGSFGALKLAQYPGAFDLDEWTLYLHNSPLTRSLEFISGMALAVLVKRHGLPPVRCIWVALPVVMSVMVFAPVETLAVNNGLFLPLSICLLLAFANPGQVLTNLGRQRGVKAAANASILIFLLHAVWIELFNTWVLPRLNSDWNLGLAAGLLLVVTLSALLADRCVCRPVTRWLIRPTFPVITVPAVRFRRPLSHAVKQPPAASA